MTPTSSGIPSSPDDGPRRLFGRRRGHRLRPGQSQRLETLLPRLALPETDEPIDLEALLGPKQDFWFEVGFGGGEHLIWQAERNPHIGFVGCEPYINGVAKLLAQIDQRGLTNIRISQADARDVMDRLPTGSLSRLFVLFPDPWPKKRHAKRRFICPATLDQMVRVLAEGGTLRVASDSGAYCAWTLRHIMARGDLVWTASSAQDWRSRPSDWPETRYDAKAKAAGRDCTYLTFVRSYGPGAGKSS